MSVVNRKLVKVIPHRTGPDPFWDAMEERFLNVGSEKQQERRWRYLAMLALRENAGWKLETIGVVFGHVKGHVVRCIERVKQEIRDTFGENPELLHAVGIAPIQEPVPAVDD